MKSAIITGCTGQNGFILTNLLISKKIKVYGISKDSLFINKSRIRKFNKNLKKSLNNFFKVTPEFVFYFASFNNH